MSRNIDIGPSFYFIFMTSALYCNDAKYIHEVFDKNGIYFFFLF